MSLIQMCDATDAGAYCDLSYKDYLKEHGRPMICKETYKGKVLFEREANGYNDSDFFATVWDSEQKKPIEIMFASTRGWCEPNFRTFADATDEIKTAYKQWELRRRVKYLILQVKEKLKTADVGDDVEVFKGRKLPKGTKGDIFWQGPCHYNKYNTIIGIRLLDGTKVFINRDNVKPVNKSKDQSLLRELTRVLKNRNYSQL